jgi:hypothetical protein
MYIFFISVRAILFFPNLNCSKLIISGVTFGQCIIIIRGETISSFLNSVDDDKGQLKSATEQKLT